MNTKLKHIHDSKGLVKIVGINHGLCLQTFLSKDGWKQEKFVDVVFLCMQPHSCDNTTTAVTQRHLKANRSVLAAASPFFASILPDYQQEEDFVITVEYTYEELFSVLEYVYSGRLVCSEEKTEHILSILEELKINTSTQSTVHQNIDNATEDSHVIETPVVARDEQVHQSKSNSINVIPNPIAEKVSEEHTYSKPINPSEFSRLLSPNVKKYRSKKNVQRTMISTINKQFTDKLLRNTIKTNCGDSRASEFTLTPPVDRQTLTNEVFDQEMGYHTVVDHTVLNYTEITKDSSQCSLLVYVCDTWDCGIYAPTISPALFAKQSKQPAKHGPLQKKTAQKTTASSSRMSNNPVLSAPEPPSDSDNVTDSVNNQTPVLHQEKIFVPRSNGNRKDSNNCYVSAEAHIEENEISTTFLENETDGTDMALALHFLNEEKRIRKRFQMRIRMLTESLNQHKQIARSVLSTTRRLETESMLEADKSKIVTKARKPRKKCETCGKMVRSSTFYIHRQTHSGVKPHLCDHCGRAFSLRIYLYNHIRYQHRESEQRRFICSTCGFTCKRKRGLEIHERIHTGERPCVCRYCDKSFRESGALVRHLRTHTGEKPYACDICGTAYAARDTYVQHYRRKHAAFAPEEPVGPKRNSEGMIIYQCDMCDKRFQRRLPFEKHRASHTGATVAIRCSQRDCTYTYSDIAELKEHMSAVHPEKIYTCSICSKVFLSKQILYDHEVRHDPSRHYRCSMCPKTVTTKASLVAHEKTHTRETPYECTVCDAKFHSPYLINIHMRKHEPLRKRQRVRNLVKILDECGSARTTVN